MWLLPSGPDQVGEASARDLQEGIWRGMARESTSRSRAQAAMKRAMPIPPANTFAGSLLDRAGDLRSDPDWLPERSADPQAVAVMLWEGRPLLEGERLSRLSLDQARDLVPDREAFRVGEGPL